MAPADIGLAGGLGRGGVFALLQFGFVETRAQHVPGGGAVLVLRAFVLAGDHNAGRDMGDAHGAVGGVDVLAAGAGRAIGVDAAVALVDLDVDPVVDDRIDPDRREAGVAAGGAVIGRDADQAVDARFRLQPAKGVVALDDDGRRLDAGLFALVALDQLDLVAAALGPAGVHAQEHLRPVLAFGAAGAGMDLEIGVVGISLARQQGFELGFVGFAFQRLQRLLGFRDDAGIAFGLAHLDQFEIVGKARLEAAQASDRFLQPGAFAHQGLRVFGVVPEIGVFGFRRQFVIAPEGCIPVKDASSAVRATA